MRSVVSQLGPGLFLPGLIYFVVSRREPALVALAAASSVPLLDLARRLLRGKRPSAMTLLFLPFAGLSVALAVHLHSPVFILAKGAVTSALFGLAFAVSAAIGRPLTRTFALRLTAEHPEHRRRLAERWRHPKVLAFFRILSIWWGLLLLIGATQQAILVFTLSPGAVMAVEPPVHALITIGGIAASVLYFRHSLRAHPELALLAERVS
jgi:intracellular septation protein A